MVQSQKVGGQKKWYVAPKIKYFHFICHFKEGFATNHLKPCFFTAFLWGSKEKLGIWQELCPWTCRKRGDFMVKLDNIKGKIDRQQWGSNPRPFACEANVLTTMLPARCWIYTSTIERVQKKNVSKNVFVSDKNKYLST